MMQAHCVGIMAVQETKLMGHLSEFNEFGVHYVGQPAQLQEGTRTGGTGFFVRDAVVPHVSYLGTRPRSRHRAPPKFAPRRRVLEWTDDVRPNVHWPRPQPVDPGCGHIRGGSRPQGTPRQYGATHPATLHYSGPCDTWPGSPAACL